MRRRSPTAPRGGRGSPPATAPTPAMASIGCCCLPPEVIDARGLKCPRPVLKTEKALAGMRPGAGLTVLATDPMAKVDIPLFCRKHGHACTESTEDGVLRFEITRAD